jgi:hypothetical protein
MIIFKENVPVAVINEMATVCHPRKYGGAYPMWIRVEYTDGEHNPPHAHLYRPGQKPSAEGLITKFLITDSPPRSREHIKTMRGKPAMPPVYADMIIEWARGKNKAGVNNWKALLTAWEQLEASFE